MKNNSCVSRSAVRLLSIILLSSSNLAAVAEVDEFDPRPGYVEGELEIEWEEAPTTIPAYPKARDLLPVPLSGSHKVTLWIDKRHITLGKDDVARFSYVIKSAAGVANAFHEGIRCETREYKTYALGARDGRFMALDDPQWETLPYFEDNTLRHTLAKFFICAGGYVARTPEQILRQVLSREEQELYQ